MAHFDASNLLKLALDTGPLPDALSDGTRDFLSGDLIDAAVREGLGGILCRRLKGGDAWGRLPAGKRHLLEQVYYSAVKKNTRLLAALSEMLEQMEASGIRAVTLQGASLLDSVYTDPGLRALTDIDLWVLPDDFDRFAGCMRRLGYRARDHYPRTFVRGKTIVDVHVHLFWADRIKARDSMLLLDQETIFAAAEKYALQGRAGWRLGRADQFVYLALHSIKHCVQRLVWLVDLHYLTRPWKVPDWVDLLRRAEELGQVRSVRYALFLLSEIAGWGPPADCRELFGEPPLKSWERRLLQKRAKHRRLPDWAPLVLLSAGLDPLGKSRFVFEHLFPAPHVLRQVFSRNPAYESWRLYGLRALQLMGLRNPH